MPSAISNQAIFDHYFTDKFVYGKAKGKLVIENGALGYRKLTLKEKSLARIGQGPAAYVKVLEFAADLNLKNQYIAKEITLYNKKQRWQPWKWISQSILDRFDPNSVDLEGNTALHTACDTGDLAKVQELIAMSANLDRPNRKGDYPLHVASRKGHLEIVKALVANKAAFYKKNDEQATAIHEAARYGHVEIAQFLLEVYPNGIDLTDKDDNTALHLACLEEHLEVIDLLHAKGARNDSQNSAGQYPWQIARDHCLHRQSIFLGDPAPLYENGFTLLHKAAWEGDCKKIREESVKIDARDINDRTALHLACMQGHLEAVKLLRASANKKDLQANTAAHLAFLHAHYTAALELLSDTDPNLQNKEGDTLLHLACRASHTASISALLERSCNVHLKNAQGRTCLHEACLAKDLQSAALLLDRGADPNAQDEENNSPFHLACRDGLLNIAQLLKDRGAKNNLPNKYGYAPLHLTFIGGHQQLAFQLIGKQDVAITCPFGRSFLHLASERGNGEFLRALLQNGFSPAARDTNGLTPLHIAAKYGNIDAIEFWCKQVDPKLLLDVDSEGKNALHHAAENGHLNAVSVLMSLGSPIDINALILAISSGHSSTAAILLNKNLPLDAVNAQGLTALQVACKRGDLTSVQLLVEAKAPLSGYLHETTLPHIIDYLLSKGASLEDTDKNGLNCMHVACAAGLLETVKHLKTKGSKLSAKALHLAARNGHQEVVQYLIEQKVDLDAMDNDGNTALHLACLNNCFYTALKLIQNGAKLLLTNKEKKNALHVTCEKGHKELALILLHYGLPINERDLSEKTALHHATLFGNPHLTTVLLSRKADIHAKDNEENTSLHLAAKAGNSKMVEALLLHQASVSAKNRLGQTALHLAAPHGHTEAALVLLRNKANPNEPDKNKQTPLHIACRFEQTAFAKELLANGASVEAQDSEGDTPLHIAAAQGDQLLIELLLKAGAKIEKVNSNGETALHKACRSASADVVRELSHHTRNPRLFYQPDYRGNRAIDLAHQRQDPQLLSVIQ